MQMLSCGTLMYCVITCLCEGMRHIEIQCFPGITTTWFKESVSFTSLSSPLSTEPPRSAPLFQADIFYLWRSAWTGFGNVRKES